MERSLDLNIKMNGDLFTVDIREPGGSGYSRIHSVLSFDEHPEFDRMVGDEIYSWLEMWADEMGEEERSDIPCGNNLLTTGTRAGRTEE